MLYVLSACIKKHVIAVESIPIQRQTSRDIVEGLAVFSAIL